MNDKNDLLQQMTNLLKWKESKQFYANKLGISIEEVNDLISEIRGYKRQIVLREEEVGTPGHLFESHNIDSEAYTVKAGWLKEKGISVMFSKKQETEDIQTAFAEFLKGFKPKENVIHTTKRELKPVDTCLVLNIQDAHYNKYDIRGNNNIHSRFKAVDKEITQVLDSSTAISNIHKVIYVVGSDIFNSEWTDMTTKGTPQSNVMSYQDSFKAICQHEVDIIELLLNYSDEVSIIYCPGNHDEFVGWHLMSWLQTYFRNQTNLSFDISPKYTKYIKFSNTAMCFNHGDGAKPEVVARNFPLEFKEHWSKCDHFLIFGGDKHTELSRDFGGIKFYRIPALSTAQSRWDSKNGYPAIGELTGFLIEDTGALTIMKRPI